MDDVGKGFEVGNGRGHGRLAQGQALADLQGPLAQGLGVADVRHHDDVHGVQVGRKVLVRPGSQEVDVRHRGQAGHVGLDRADEDEVEFGHARGQVGQGIEVDLLVDEAEKTGPRTRDVGHVGGLGRRRVDGEMLQVDRVRQEDGLGRRRAVAGQERLAARQNQVRLLGQAAVGVLDACGVAAGPEAVVVGHVVHDGPLAESADVIGGVRHRRPKDRPLDAHPPHGPADRPHRHPPVDPPQPPASAHGQHDGGEHPQVFAGLS